MIRQLLLGLAMLMASITAAAGLPDFCSEDSIASSGGNAGFNQAQCRTFLAPIRTPHPQVGNTSLCESLLNIGFEFGIAGDMQDAKRFTNSDCTSLSFNDLYTSVAAVPEFHGHVFGGFNGLLSSGNIVSGNGAIEAVIQAVALDKVVVVSLDPQPIYDEIYEATKAPYSSMNDDWRNFLSFSGTHTLLVRAVHMNALGHVDAVGVIDSAGYSRRYWIPLPTFVKAYKSMRTAATRGVYISDAKRKR